MECAAAPRPRAWSAARPCRSPGRPGSSRAKRNACNAIRLAAGRTLGLEIGQLNGDFGYPHRPHRQPAHHAQRHRHADAGADADAGAVARDPRSVRQRAAGAARARLSTYELRALPPAGRARARRTSTSATPRRWRDQCLRHHAHARRSRHHGSAPHRAGFGGAFGGGRARNRIGSGRHAAAGAAHDRHRGCAAADRLGERPCELQLRVQSLPVAEPGQLGRGPSLC